jgi:hypothetical protein
MKVKSVFYAAVGAPVVVARKVGDKTSEVYGKINDRATGYGETAGKTIDSWAVEGEKVVVRVKEGNVVDEITSKVDLDQAKEQVGKLRDQLEDMLDTWRHSFRPEKAEEKETKAPEKKAEPKPAAKKPAAKKPAAKSTESKSPAAKTTKSPAAEKSSEETAPAPEAEKAS